MGAAAPSGKDVIVPASHNKRIIYLFVNAILSLIQYGLEWFNILGTIAGPATVRMRWERKLIFSSTIVSIWGWGAQKKTSIILLQVVQEALSVGLLNEIRQSTNGNFALGSEKFKGEIGNALGRRVTHGRPGRPRKSKSPGQ